MGLYLFPFHILHMLKLPACGLLGNQKMCGFVFRLFNCPCKVCVRVLNLTPLLNATSSILAGRTSTCGSRTPMLCWYQGEAKVGNSVIFRFYLSLLSNVALRMCWTLPVKN